MKHTNIHPAVAAMLTEHARNGDSTTLDIFPASGTWTKRAGATSVDIFICAGGGAASETQNGGDGGTAFATYAASDLPDLLEITVGLGGQGASPELSGQDGFAVVLSRFGETTEPQLRITSAGFVAGGGAGQVTGNGSRYGG